VIDFLKASLGVLAPALFNNSGYVILSDVELVPRKPRGKQASPTIKTVFSVGFVRRLYHSTDQAEFSVSGVPSVVSEECLSVRSAVECSRNCR
jgi:hypothetical protein